LIASHALAFRADQARERRRAVSEDHPGLICRRTHTPVIGIKAVEHELVPRFRL
jgi:hypothetical protein